METTQPDILVDIQPQLVQASSGKRLANYFVDLIGFYIVMFIVGMVIGLFSPSNVDDAGIFSENPFLDQLLSLFLYGVYMSIVEAIFQGRSIGKFITGTKAVNFDGSTIGFSTALGRGFSRIVPFEPFSALGGTAFPWHDKWTGTFVIDIKDSSLST